MALEPDLAAHGFREAFDDIQTETAAGDACVLSRLDAPEGSKQVSLRALGDAHPVILDANVHSTCLNQARVDANLTALGAVFDGVLQQIGDNLGQPRTVRPDSPVLRNLGIDSVSRIMKLSSRPALPSVNVTPRRYVRTGLGRRKQAPIFNSSLHPCRVGCPTTRQGRCTVLGWVSEPYLP